VNFNAFLNFSTLAALSNNLYSSPNLLSTSFSSVLQMMSFKTPSYNSFSRHTSSLFCFYQAYHTQSYSLTAFLCFSYICHVLHVYSRSSHGLQSIYCPFKLVAPCLHPLVSCLFLIGTVRQSSSVCSFIILGNSDVH